MTIHSILSKKEKIPHIPVYKMINYSKILGIPARQKVNSVDVGMIFYQ